MSIDLGPKEREELLKRSIEEYEHDIKYRNKREPDWLGVDEMYYGKKKKSLVTRANVHVPKMLGTTETFTSKVDDTPFMQYDAMEEGDRPKVPKLNAILNRERRDGLWDIIDVVGKKECALYGRQTYKKFSTNEGGFKDYFEPMAITDFYIDPLAGGLKPLEYGRHMGHDNIIKSRWELEGKQYNKKAVGRLVRKLDGDSDADNKYRSKSNTREALGLSEAVLYNEESVKLTEHYTMYRGEWWYILMSVDFKEAVRMQKLTDVMLEGELPFLTWAIFPRIDEFYTPGLGELIKEPNIIQNIILNQMLDNNAYQNYGMTAYDSTKITNPAELKPRPMGKVAVNGDPRAAVMKMSFPNLDNGVAMYNLVEQIFDKETGVNSAAKGMPNSKRMSATEFAGLLDQVADAFIKSNKLYKGALYRLMKLFYLGVEKNMSQNQRVKILGAEGYEWASVNGKDLKGNYDIIISTGAQEEQNKNLMRDRWNDYITRNRENPRLNQKFLDEKEAQIMGMEESEIQRLLNPEMESDWESLAEAARENELMLGKEVEPNKSATTGHVEKHLMYLRKTQNLKPEVRKRIIEHSKAELEFARKNKELTVNKLIEKEVGAQALELNEEAQRVVENPTPSRGIATPDGVDPAAFAAALQGQGPGAATQGADNFTEQTRLDAVRQSPTTGV